MPVLESIAIGGAIAKGGLGLIQAWKASRMKPQRPEYQVPGAIQDAASTARNLVNSGERPGRSAAEEAIRQTTANAVNASRSSSSNSSELLAAISAASNRENQAMLNQDQLDANFKLQANNQLLQSLRQLGAAQDKRFQLNQMEPYLNDARTKAALTQGAIGNIFGAANDLGSVYGMREGV